MFPVVPAIFRVYRSITVGCELSLRLEMRTYIRRSVAKSVGISTPAVAETHFGPRAEGSSSPPHSQNIGRRALDFWCMPIVPFMFSGQPQGLLASME